jgi:hypothetical protein
MKSPCVRRATACDRLHTLVFVALAACAEPPEYSETESAISVGGAVDGTCSTATVRGLSKQIAEEVDCLSPDSLVRLSPTPRIQFTSNAVLPYMHAKARADLLRVAEDHTLKINSGYRTVAQQYLLYRWFRAGRCGITAAAIPGRSNHESGRAVDLANWSSRVGAMADHHWSHSVPGDPVHFDNTRSPDNRGKDVRAFQRLWNRNHPGDKIDVDGVYGPQTASALKRSPAKGFKKGAFCRAIDPGADVLVIDGPDRVAGGAHASYAITIANNDPAEWSAGTRVIVSGGVASELADPSWRSPSDVRTLDTAVAPGGEVTIDIGITAPAVLEDTPAAVTFALVDGELQRGTFELAVLVTPTADAEDTSGDAGDDHDLDEDPADEMSADEDGVVHSGCSAGAGAGWALALLIGIRARRGRRSGTASRLR